MKDRSKKKVTEKKLKIVTNTNTEGHRKIITNILRERER
jgi:hypothetical protein